MKKVIVTGGSGKVGSEVINILLEEGYEVVNVDIHPPAEKKARYLKTDLTDLGQVCDVLYNYEAVIHLAAIPSASMLPGERTFQNNIASTYNVFRAASILGVRKVVWASSDTVYGLPFQKTLPEFFPVTEEHRHAPATVYALSKSMGENIAHFFSENSTTCFVGLRFTFVRLISDYQSFPQYWEDLHAHKFNLWGYVDVRDVAQSCKLALQSDVKAAENFTIAAADTVMKQPTRELIEAVFPQVPLKRNIEGFETLLSIEKARQLLGYRPRHSWRDYLKY